jgi:hypothetical protein
MGDTTPSRPCDTCAGLVQEREDDGRIIVKQKTRQHPKTEVRARQRSAASSGVESSSTLSPGPEGPQGTPGSNGVHDDDEPDLASAVAEPLDVAAEHIQETDGREVDEDRQGRIGCYPDEEMQGENGGGLEEESQRSNRRGNGGASSRRANGVGSSTRGNGGASSRRGSGGSSSTRGNGGADGQGVSWGSNGASSDNGVRDLYGRTSDRNGSDTHVTAGKLASGSRRVSPEWPVAKRGNKGNPVKGTAPVPSDASDDE